jgi:serine/threonine protein kinase
VGRYAFLELIGQGGTGSVWMTWDRRDRRMVAAKVLSIYTGGPDPAALMRFVREQSLRIRHPHVLTPTGWAAEDDVVLLVTELVRGGSLLDLLREDPRLPESFVVVLLDQLLQALAAVHSHGVVHGDVKPANLLLEATGPGRPHLRLADFGVATYDADGVRFESEPPIGTPGYLAPEQVEGAAPDTSQDVYAAGVVARRMLLSPGAVTTLLDSMTRADALRRPSAAEALARLRSLPVKRGGTWPVVPDRLTGRGRHVPTPS